MRVQGLEQDWPKSRGVVFGPQPRAQIGGDGGIAQPQRLHVAVAFVRGDHVAGPQRHADRQTRFQVHKRMLVLWPRRYAGLTGHSSSEAAAR